MKTSAFEKNRSILQQQKSAYLNNIHSIFQTWDVRTPPWSSSPAAAPLLQLRSWSVEKTWREEARRRRSWSAATARWDRARRRLGDLGLGLGFLLCGRERLEGLERHWPERPSEGLVWPRRWGARPLGLCGLWLWAGSVHAKKMYFAGYCRVSGSGTTETGVNPRNMSGCIMCPATAPRG